MGEEEVTTKEAPNTSRFSYWIAVMAFSAIALGTFRSLDNKDDYLLKKSEENWVLAGTIIAMTFSFFAVCGHAVADKFVGTFHECVVAVLCVAVWCGLLPFIMKPDNGLAVAGFAGEYGVTNANMYFFSWGAFISSWLILAMWTQEVKVANFANASKHMVHWYVILAASIVVLWTASTQLDDYDAWLKVKGIDGCDNATGKEEETCKRTSFAVAVGGIGTIVALVFVILSRCGKCGGHLVMMITSVLLFALYAFGVGFVTFGNGPATMISNLYFAIWIGFIYCMFMFANAVGNWWSSRNADAGGEEQEEAPAEKSAAVPEGKDEEGHDEQSENEPKAEETA